MSEANGNGSSNETTITVGDPDTFGRRTVVLAIGAKEIFRDMFSPDSAVACDNFAKQVHKHAPNGYAEGVVRHALNLNDDRFIPDLSEPFSRIIRQRIIANMSAKASAGTTGSAITYNRITAAEMATATYNVDFHIPGVLVRGQPQGMFGAKKSLKTSLMLDQAIAVSTGGCWLGYFRANLARVAVFSGESGMPTIQETCLRQCRAAGIELADTGIIFSDMLPQFGSLAHLDAFEKFLIADGIELVYIDPVYLAMITGGNEGSLFAMGGMLRSISELCQRIGVTLVLLHHMKKSVADPYSPGDLDDASWAGFAEFCRGWMLVNRREKYELGSGLHKLWLSVGGSVGHSGLWGLDVYEGVYGQPGGRIWNVEVLKADEVRAAVADDKDAIKQQKRDEQLDRDVKAIVRVLAKFPAGETKSIIRDRAGLSVDRCSAALAASLDQGYAVACGVMKGNQKTPRDGYKLAEAGGQI